MSVRSTHWPADTPQSLSHRSKHVHAHSSGRHRRWQKLVPMPSMQAACLPTLY